MEIEITQQPIWLRAIRSVERLILAFSSNFEESSSYECSNVDLHKDYLTSGGTDTDTPYDSTLNESMDHEDLRLSTPDTLEAIMRVLIISSPKKIKLPSR